MGTVDKFKSIYKRLTSLAPPPETMFKLVIRDKQGKLLLTIPAAGEEPMTLEQVIEASCMITDPAHQPPAAEWAFAPIGTDFDPEAYQKKLEQREQDRAAAQRDVETSDGSNAINRAAAQKKVDED